MGAISPRTTHLRIPLKPLHAIGRVSDRDLCLPYREVSSNHAVLRWGSQGWQLRDLRSTNGTLLNGERVQPEEWVDLAEGDELSFGHPDISYILVDVSAPG